MSARQPHLCVTLIVCSFAISLFAQPVRIHPANPHYLEYKGKPFLVVTSAEHYGAVLNPDFDFRKYLAALAREGMNYTRIFTGAYVEVPGNFGIKRNTLAPEPARFLAPWARSETPGYPGGGNKFDLSRWSGEYFERLRAFVAEANRHDIVIEVTFFTSTYGDTQWKSHPFNPANNVNGTEVGNFKNLHTLDNGNILPHQEALVRKIVRELNAFDNVIFEIQNEPWADQGLKVNTRNPYLQPPARDKFPNSIDIPTEAALDWHDRVAAWIVEEENPLPRKHLIAFNYCNFFQPVHRIPKHVSIVNFHYAYPEAVRLNLGLGKLIGYDESGFQGGDDATYRKEAWNFLLAGGGLFNSLDYSFTVGREDGTDTEPNGPGGGSPALRAQLRILREFLESFDLVAMKPAPEVVVRAPGAFVQSLGKPGDAYALYLDPAPASTELVLALPAGTYAAEWVDPLTGKSLGESLVSGGQPRTLTVPVKNRDVALRVKRSSD